jgi:hypothetical protein
MIIILSQISQNNLRQISKSYIVVNQWCHDTYTMLTSLEDRPVNRIKCLVVEDAKFGHQAQWVANADPQGLASDRPSTHGHKRIHYFRDSSVSRVTRVERGIEWLSRRGLHILIQTQPVHICSTGSPFHAVQAKLSPLAVYIGVPSQLNLKGLDEGLQRLWGDWQPTQGCFNGRNNRSNRGSKALACKNNNKEDSELHFGRLSV